MCVTAPESRVGTRAAPEQPLRTRARHSPCHNPCARHPCIQSCAPPRDESIVRIELRLQRLPPEPRVAVHLARAAIVDRAAHRICQPRCSKSCDEDVFARSVWWIPARLQACVFGMCGQVKPAPKTVLQGDDGKPSLADAVGGLVRATVEREHEVLPVLVMGQEARLEASERSTAFSPMRSPFVAALP